jgi:hypothetical protein
LETSPFDKPHFRWATVAALCWILLLAGIAVHGFFHHHHHTVFDIYATGAKRWWAGEDMYVRGRDYYRYSPLFAVAVTPFAVLPPALGNALWKLVNGAAYAWGLVVWGRSLGLDSGRRAALSILALPLALHSLHNGQANLLMIATILFALAAAARARWTLAAFALAAATLIKGYPLGLALLLSVLYQGRFVLRYAAALACGLLVPFATNAPAYVLSAYTGWFHHLRDSEHLMRKCMRSLDYFFAVNGHPLQPATFALVGLLAGLATLALCIHERRHACEPCAQLAQTFAWFSVWVVLFGPSTESCTYAIVSPPLARAVLQTFERSGGWRSAAVLLAAALLMGILSTDLFPAPVRALVNEHAGQPIGALLFAAYLFHRLKRNDRPRPSSHALTGPHFGRVTAYSSSSRSRASTL